MNSIARVSGFPSVGRLRTVDEHRAIARDGARSRWPSRPSQGYYCLCRPRARARGWAARSTELHVL
jgi:hypothetical protein